MDIDIAPVIIPVYDSDDEDENSDDSRDEFEETSSPDSCTATAIYSSAKLLDEFL